MFVFAFAIQIDDDDDDGDYRSFYFTEASKVNISKSLCSKVSDAFLDAHKALTMSYIMACSWNYIKRSVPVGFTRLLENWCSRLCCVVYGMA